MKTFEYYLQTETVWTSVPILNCSMEIKNIFHMFDKGTDEELDKWFLMGSPFPVISILIMYLLFVLKVGPKLMQNTQPYQLKKILFAYNLFQILYNSYIFYQAIRVNRIKDSLQNANCQFVRTPAEHLAFIAGGWHYFISKMLDLLDTLFFVLRKKYKQISFLHVFHHSIMMLYAWVFLKYNPGEQGTFVVFLNSFVHILMYTYYLMAVLGPQYQKYLWWKKYMTTIQLIQFTLIGLYYLLRIIKGCEVSTSFTVFYLSNTIFFFYLFSKFYKNTYNSKTSKIKNN